VTDVVASGPTIRGTDDAPTAAEPRVSDTVQTGSRIDAIRTAGARARRRRFWDIALDWDLPEGTPPLGVRLGLPTSTEATIVTDAQGIVDANADVRFLAKDFKAVVEMVDGKWKPIPDQSLRELAELHAAGMDDSDAPPPFENDVEAFQQLFTIDDPPQVNVQTIVALAQAYREWAASGAEEDGDPISGP
jgi:hypothetical protein